MNDTLIKKLIVISTSVILLFLWLSSRPYSINSTYSDYAFKYKVKKIKGADDDMKLIFALHGNGDTLDNFNDTLFHDLDISARLILIRGPIKYQNGYAWPMNGQKLKKWGDALADVVQQLTMEYGQSEKPALVGFSGGGFMAYYLAAVHPELFSSILPISGGLDSQVIDETVIEEDLVKISAFHGREDTLVHFITGKNAAAYLTKLGRDVEFIELPGGHLSVFTNGHEVFKETLKKSLSTI